MQMSYMLFWVSLCVLSPQLSQTHGMRLRGLEKRGWTLNSAGYLLGPYAHRTLTVRHGGSVGKRESTEDFVLPTPQPSYNESYLHALIEFLTYLRMKDNKSIEEVISSTFTDDGT
ncbi:galanin peptides-like isoform X2 [Hemibagrus wyckioides]|uniref:galanin peptides-like isoform X2 n=1 Tax=Hemibagrus wyckioides TaxID=337641 RepID=UPI00266C1CA1|nr:galanin peptides-like isoform X2 [Hemibagrus wyckioides]